MTTVQVPRTVDRETLLAPLVAGQRVRGTWTPLYEHDAEYRRRITARNVLRFALVYFPHHLRSPETRGQTSFSRLHVDMARAALRWTDRYSPWRDAWLAPRGSAKSTWMLILVLWALAHRHRTFALLYSDTTDQIRVHMADIRLELDRNEWLQEDFPHIVPVRGARGSSDTALTVVGSGGAAIAARGMDSRTLGIKVGADRPNLVWLDDLEPDETNYGDEARRKRLATITQVILPMNEWAAVQWTGTVTRYGSLTHALVRAAVGDGEPEHWITGTGFQPRYYPALLRELESDGTEVERSLWPARWSAAWLQALRRDEPLNYALNFLGQPPEPGGKHWTARSFRYRALPVARRIVHVDPAVTVTEQSDETAVCVVGDIRSRPGHVLVEYCRGRRVNGAGLRRWLVRLLASNPDVRTVVLEANAGGEWEEILTRPRADGADPWPAGVTLVQYKVHVPKRDRLATLEGRYERGEVVHSEPHPELERQMTRYPDVAHDDLMDSVAGAVQWLRDNPLRDVA